MAFVHFSDLYVKIHPKLNNYMQVTFKYTTMLPSHMNFTNTFHYLERPIQNIYCSFVVML